MATDIYLSKEVHQQYSFHSWHDCEAGVGSMSVIHDPCNTDILEVDTGKDIDHWDVMEAMSKHNRECAAGKSKRHAPLPGLHIPESEIRRE